MKKRTRATFISFNSDRNRAARAAGYRVNLIRRFVRDRSGLISQGVPLDEPARVFLGGVGCDTHKTRALLKFKCL